ncbi:MAG: hypothetical protein CVU05_08025 [Bacteroidetes bacterium HGW-Bacteroidetes-21]|jgi:hypothetical protein|nr:MAG: hypothetical protein CVU05_08025 [Bacteroidetes bacterium HGW-Bacteroidetes-21]
MKLKFLFSLLFPFILFSCVKTDIIPTKDYSAPKIHLKGNNPMIVTLNTIFTDPGATATDNVDGTRNLSDKIIVTHNIPIDGPSNGSGLTNTTGSYIISYSVTDKAGNTTTNNRTIIIKNSAEKYAVQYLFSKTGGQIFPNFNNELTVIDYDQNINNRIHFTEICNQSGFIVFADIIGDTTIDIPDQGVILNQNGIDNLYRIYGIAGQSIISDSTILTLTIEYNLEKYYEASVIDYDFYFGNRYWKNMAFSVNTEYYERL